MAEWMNVQNFSPFCGTLFIFRDLFENHLQNIVGTPPEDAFVDMTGALSERVQLGDQLKDRNHLWKRMMTSNDPVSGVLLTAQYHRWEDGHVFSITAVKQISTNG